MLQALQYKGKITKWSLTQFLNTIPKSPNGNPNNGFVGSPFVENSWTYSVIYPAPLATWGQKYGNVQNISGSSMTTLLNEVKNGNPVVAWVTINFQPIRWGNWSFGVAANNKNNMKNSFIVPCKFSFTSIILFANIILKKQISDSTITSTIHPISPLILSL